MAHRTYSDLVLLALFGAVLFLQVALAAETVAEVPNGDLVTPSTKADTDFNNSPSRIDRESNDEASDMADLGHMNETGEDLGSEDLANEGTTAEGEEELGEIQPYEYVPGTGNAEVVADDEDQHQEASVAARPLARILHERSSKKCWSNKKCHKFYKRAGCCMKKCVNLSSSNSHCGKCKKHCDTKKGYFCTSGKCRKHRSHKVCHKKKDCKGENSCCEGKCVNLDHDCKNCGKCGTKCPWGSACCDKQCKNLKTDCKNCGKCGHKCSKGKVCCEGECIWLKKSGNHCGKCGKKCGWGRKCCHGKCVSVASDADNCGRCGKECPSGVKCVYGICGYGL